MANFDFDLEQAGQELEDAEHLISVFLGFFNEERPFGKEPNTTEAVVFVQNSEIYESVIGAAWDKIHKLRTDMEAAVEAYFKSAKKKGGEAA